MRSELDKPLHLPTRLREELKKVHGEVISEPTLKERVKGKYVITVGDVVTHTLLKLGIKPDVAIVDYKTKRDTINFSTVRKFGEKVIKVNNPAGTITPELWRAVKLAIQTPEKTRIDVNGEEDLAVLPAVILAPEGAMVIYGIPNTGLAVIEIRDEDKKSAMRIIKEMEV